VNAHDHYEHEILTAIGGGRSVSQRSLAQSLGIALGLTNLLVRRLVRKGWVRVTRIRPNRVRYFLTPAGAAEKARLSRLYLQDAIRFYATARDRISESLANAGGPSTKIVFYGTGEIAEIAYVCLQATTLTLVGVVNAAGEPNGSRFFGMPVHSCDDVRDGTLGDIPFDRLIVTSFTNQEAARERLDALGVAPERVHWL